MAADSALALTTRPFHPMWFNKIDAKTTEALLAALVPYIASSDWMFEEKLNGHRVVISIENGVVTVLGKSGQISQHTALFADRNHTPVLAVLAGLCDVILDAELVEGKLWVFDMAMLTVGGKVFVTNATSWADRRLLLGNLFNTWNPNRRYFGLLPYAEGTEAKQALLDTVQGRLGEGIMLKRVDAPYKLGPRRTSGAFKGKLWKTATFIVEKVDVDDHHNAVLELLDHEGTPVVVGRCSLNGKPDVTPGMLIEVEYLHFDKESIVQPNLLCIRTDVDRSECVLTQLVGTDKRVVTA